MQIRKCHLCNSFIYPGEIRCLISIHIFPDQNDEILWDDIDSDDDSYMDDCLEDGCFCGADECLGEDIREAHIVLCKNCQDQFLENPSVKDNLLFPNKETQSKTFH